MSAQLPKSAVPVSIGLVGLVAFAVAWTGIYLAQPPAVVGGAILLAATGLPMLFCELRGERAKAKRTIGQPKEWLVGFATLSAPFLFFAPFVSQQPLGIVLAAWAIIAPSFLIRQAIERAGLFAGFPATFGKALLSLNLAGINGADVRLWILKSFFMPFYGVALFFFIKTAYVFDFGSPSGLLTAAVFLIFTIDIVFGLSGYAFGSQRLPTAFRNTQPSRFGWVVCLASYLPLWLLWPTLQEVGHRETTWPLFLGENLLSTAAAILLLLSLALYISGTIVFGVRFSNLANRGIVTTGPYRYMKHPAYFAHSANAWTIALLLLPGAGLPITVDTVAAALFATVIYRLRSVTEERHLSSDPVYVEYAAWIEQHGLVAKLRRLFSDSGRNEQTAAR